MSPGIAFTKLSGAGNDFILVCADRSRKFSGPALARRLCSRRGSIGADGLLLVRRRGRGGLPEVRYYNADGSPAFCANGSRCAAWWMHARGFSGRRLSMRTSRGVVAAWIAGEGRVRLRMPEVGLLRPGIELAAAGRRWTAHVVDTGVPHAVVEARRLDRFPVEEVGRALRRHRAFGPKGANVDFVRVERGRVRVRTYERGVEGETLACGTGAVAAAVFARERRGLRPPIRVATRGGALLTVRFDSGAAWLEGPARIVFEGEVPA